MRLQPRAAKADEPLNRQPPTKDPTARRACLPAVGPNAPEPQHGPIRRPGHPRDMAAVRCRCEAARGLPGYEQGL